MPTLNSRLGNHLLRNTPGMMLPPRQASSMYLGTVLNQCLLMNSALSCPSVLVKFDPDTVIPHTENPCSCAFLYFRSRLANGVAEQFNDAFPVKTDTGYSTTAFWYFTAMRYRSEERRVGKECRSR